jgi:hypothetical protein
VPSFFVWAVSAIGAGVGGAVGAGLIMGAVYIGTALYYATLIAYAASQKSRAKRRARDAFNANLQDRLVMVSTTDGPRSRIYGRVRNTDGVLFKATRGANSEFYTLVIALAGHEVDAIETVYFDELPVTLDGDGWVTSAPYAKTVRTTYTSSISGAAGSMVLPRVPVTGSVFIGENNGSGDGGETNLVYPSVTGSTVTLPANIYGPAFGRSLTYQSDEIVSKARVRKYLGTSSQNLSTILQPLFPSLVTTADRFRGIACLLVDLEFDTDAFPTGVPSMTATMRGAKILDTRTSTTAWTQNPALMARDWSVYTYGGNVPTASIGTASFNAAANACDVTHGFETEDGTTNRPMYTAGLAIPMGGADPTAWLDELTEAMAGRWAWGGGQLRVRAGAYSSPVATITEDWLSGAGAINVVPEPPSDQAINVVRATIADSAQDYVSVPAPPTRAAAYITLDGRELPSDVVYAAVTDTDHAQHVAGVQLREARSGLTCELPCNLRAFALEVFDTVQVTLPRYGWSAKLFEVLDWKFSREGGVVLTLRETAPSIYDPDAEFLLSDATPNTQLPAYNVVPTVGNLTITSGTTALSDGSILTRTRVQWPAVASEAVRQSGYIEVQYRLETPGGGSWVNAPNENGASVETVINGLKGGFVYTFRARAVNSLGVRGVWSRHQAHLVAQPPASELKNLSLRTTSQIFQVNKAGTASPTSITLTAIATNLAGSPSFSVTSGTATLTGSGTTRALSYANLSTDAATIQVSQDGLTDSVTIVKLREGADSVIGLLTNEVHVIPSEADGTIDSGDLAAAGGTFLAWRGLTPLNSAGGVFSLVGSAGLTIGINSSTGVYTVTALIADVATATLRCAFAGVNVDKVYTITKSRQGANGSSAFNWVTSGNVTASGSSVRRTSGEGAWDAGASSVEQFQGGAYVSATAEFTNRAFAIGLNIDPLTDNDFAGIDYAWRTTTGGVLQIYESGTLRGSFGSYTTSTVFMVVYDGADVRYFKDGVIQRTVAAGAGLRMHVDASMFTAGAQINNVAFGPVGPRGTDGASASLLVLTGTAQAFTFNGANAAAPTSQTITFQAILGNLSGSATFLATRYNAAGTSLGTVTLGGSGNTRTLTIAQFGAAAYCTVTASLSGFSDQITVVRLTDGAATVHALLSNESVTVPAAPDGTVVSGSLTSAGGTYRVWQGATNVTGAGPTYSLVTSTGVTIAINSVSGVYTVSAMSGTLGTATLRAVFAGVTIDRVYSIAKSIAGEAGVDAEGPVLIGRGGVVVTGNTAEKTSGGNVWNADCYSRDGFTGGAYMTAVPEQTNCAVMFGLNTDPTTGNVSPTTYESLDWAIYCTSSGTLQIWESGSNRGSFGVYAPGDVLAVTYDGAFVRYLKNGVVLRSIAAIITATVHADSAFQTVGGRLTHIRFGPMSKVSDIGTDQITTGAVTDGVVVLELSGYGSTATWPNSAFAKELEMSTAVSTTLVGHRALVCGSGSVWITLPSTTTATRVRVVYSLVPENAAGAPLSLTFPIIYATDQRPLMFKTAPEAYAEAFFPFHVSQLLTGGTGFVRYRVVLTVEAFNNAGDSVAPGGITTVPGGALPNVSFLGNVSITDNKT